MRPLLIPSLLVALAGCESGPSTGPESPVIIVRLQEAGGVPVGRTQVILTPASGAEIVTRSRSDGTVEITVDAAGVHRVRVIPRDGYVGREGTLSRDVAVAPGTRTLVSFTLYPVGNTGEQAEPSMVPYGP